MTKPEHQSITTVLHSEEAATLSIAMICLLEFTKELAAKSSNGITIDQAEIDKNGQTPRPSR